MALVSYRPECTGLPVRYWLSLTNLVPGRIVQHAVGGLFDQGEGEDTDLDANEQTADHHLRRGAHEARLLGHYALFGAGQYASDSIGFGDLWKRTVNSMSVRPPVWLAIGCWPVTHQAAVDDGKREARQYSGGQTIEAARFCNQKECGTVR